MIIIVKAENGSNQALLGFGLVLTYNGERGKQNKLINYLFYPVHLLILGLLEYT